MNSGTWPARGALLVSILASGAVIASLGAFDAFGAPSPQVPIVVQTTASPTPTPSESEEECDVPLPAPPPICPEESESASPSPSPSESGTPSPTPSREHDSRVSIRYDDDRFKGRVRSAARCERQRKVVLRKVRKGPNRIVGRDQTNRKGQWRISRDDVRGRFYATVMQRVFNDDGTRVTCRKDISKTIRV